MKKFSNKSKRENSSIEERINVDQLKEIYDDFIRLSSSQSQNDFISLFNLLENIDKTILINPLIVNHPFNYFITDILYDLFKNWNQIDYLTEFESFLFVNIINILTKTNFNPQKLIRSIKKSLNSLSIYGKHLNDKFHLKYFSKLIFLYNQNEQIINEITKCLSSIYYIQMFEQTTTTTTEENKFILFTLPTYWIKYKGTNKEEMANNLLNALLVPSTRILKQKSFKQSSKSVNQLIHLLNQTFLLTNLIQFSNSKVIKFTNTLLSLLNKESLFEKRQSIIKNSIRLLLTLMNKSDNIQNHVKQREDTLQKLLNIENDIYLILSYFMDENKIKIMIKNNKIFHSAIEEYIKQKNNEEFIQNQFLIKRLECILESSVSVGEEDVINEGRIVNKSSIESIVALNDNKNKEDITLIWYDKHIGKRFDTNKSLELFQRINDYVLTCSDEETLIKYIEQIKTEKVFLILSGKSTEDILDHIHDHPQIDSIFIFSIKYEKYQNYLNNQKYYKIIGIYTEQQPLLIAIQENIRYFIKQSQAITLFDQEERELTNLNKDLFQFRSFLIFKQVLLKSSYKIDMAKREMIETCRNYYRNNKKELLNIEEFERTYKCEDAIYWYTKQTFIYRLVNKALRTEDYDAILILRFFIVDLCQNLREKYEDLKKRQKNSSIVVSYRGLKLSPTEIHNLKCNIGKTIATNGFLSTTRSKNVAYTFALRGTKRLNVETVMLEIDADISKLTAILADVAQYSDYPSEEEILFDLGASFTINSINYDKIQMMWLVKLTAQSEESFNNDIQNFIQDNCSTTDMNLLLGELFFMMEKFDTSRKYFENILNLYKNDQSDKFSKIYDYIGRSYEAENDFDKAIIYYTKAFDHYNLLNQLEDIARITNSIGVMYFNKNDKINTKIYFKKSYDIWMNIKSANDYCEIGRIMNCFGCLEDENNIACDYFLKALEIYKNQSLKCHFNNHDFFITQIYENLAERYYQDKNYDKALDYIIKSVNIRKKYISTLHERKNYIKSLMKLWTVCQENHQNIWLTYQDQFLQLADIEVIKLIPQLKDFINDVIILKRNYLDSKQDDNSASNDLLEHSLKSLKLINKTDPQNLNKIIQLQIDIGLAYAKTKDYHWASQHYEQALQLCQNHTQNHSKLLSTIFQCQSDLLLDKHEYDDAVNLSIKAISINEKTCHLTQKEKEAQSYFNIGEKLMTTNFDKALEFFQKSLEIRQKCFQKDDIIIGLCHEGIGATYINQLMFDTALEHYQEAIKIFEKHLFDKEEYEFNVKLLYGKCHSDLGRIYYNQNDYDKSTEYFLKTIKMMESSFPSDNPCFLSDCYEGIGLNYYKKSEYDLSMVFYKKCLDFLVTHIQSSVLCDHRKEISSCLINLSCVYIDKKEYELALDSLEKVNTILPENHKNLSNSYLFMGLCYMEQKQYENAINYYKNAIANFEQHSPINQENYALCFCNIGLCYSNMQKDLYEKAIDWTLKAIDIYQHHCPEKQSNIAQCYWTYAFILSKKGQYDQAINAIYKSLQLRINEDSINVGLSYHLLGLCHYKKLEYKEALKFLEISMKNYEKHMSDLNNEVGASIFNDIALCLIKINNYKSALEYAIKSFQIRDKIFPLIDLQKAESHCTLALIYFKQNYEKCNEHRIKALELSKELILNGEDIENIGELFENIAQLYSDEKNLKQARKYYKKALKYMKKDKVDDHMDIQRLEIIFHKLTKSSTTQ